MDLWSRGGEHLWSIHGRTAEERIDIIVGLTLILLNSAFGSLLLLLFLISWIERLGRHNLLIMVDPLLLLDHLLVEVLLHLLEPACLLSGKGLARDLHAACLDLSLSLGKPLKDLGGQHDRLDILESSSYRWCHVVLVEDLVLMVEGCDHIDHPLLVWDVELVDPCDVQLLLGADLLDLVVEGVLDRGAHAVLDADILSLWTPVNAFEDIHQHDFIDGRAALHGQVVPVPDAGIVEVTDTERMWLLNYAMVIALELPVLSILLNMMK